MPPASDGTATATVVTPGVRGGPFDPDDPGAYRSWRARKLERYPAAAGVPIVALGDPRALTGAERRALQDAVDRTGMAAYASPLAGVADKDIPRLLGAQLGLQRLDRNWLADDDGISQVKVVAAGSRSDFIPYTNRPIRWHTDGYYNPPERSILGMVLHCVDNAADGGQTGLLDHEIAYLLLRDESPELVRALLRTDAMTIPERVDDDGTARPAETGPVFRVDPATGTLSMRYTARTRSIVWHPDPDVTAAAAALARLLASPSPWIHRLTLQPGMGLVCNNVLHERSGFVDDPSRPRLLYRARYYDRVATAH
ncbi:MAG: TauD/TfdA family dioxygenase [Betaproteobacteria bacterium]|nr:TauD/TfdA family dioxygenase [Betaproteobacteria bacterium]